MVPIVGPRFSSSMKRLAEVVILSQANERRHERRHERRQDLLKSQANESTNDQSSTIPSQQLYFPNKVVDDVF